MASSSSDPGSTLDESLHLVLEASPIGLLIVRPDGSVERANSQAEKAFGRPAGELVGRSVDELVPERYREDHGQLREDFLRAPETRPMGAGRELYALHRDGSEFPVEIGLNPIAGDPLGRILVSVIDITERKREEERFRAAVEASPSGILMVDPEGTILLANSTIESIFGYAQDELVGQSVEQLIPGDVAGQHPELRSEFLQSPSARPMGAGRNLFGLRKDGSLVPLEIGLNPYTKDDHTYVLASIIDISERLREEEQQQALAEKVQHAQRLESLGMLAGGIAHDFNNILAAILGYSELALGEIESTSEVHPRLANIKQAALSASQLTRQMLAYAGKGQGVKEPVSLNQEIRQIIDLLQVSISKRAALKLDLADELPPIEADRGQIQQLMMNLVTNASDAVAADGGLIGVKTRRIVLGKDEIQGYHLAENLRSGQYVSIEVSDSGEGMSDETRRRVFDPFFTTKREGRGLGMAAVHGIVRSHGGGIRLYSEIGRGTAVKVILPLGEETETGRVGSDRSEEEARGSVLVVDDEEHVRQVARGLLERLGFEVLTAADGFEALSSLEARDGQLTAVILDAIMPRLDGKETLKRIRRRWPDLPVIVSSGYNKEALGTDYAGRTVEAFLPKPYEAASLEAVMRGLLDSPRGEPD